MKETLPSSSKKSNSKVKKSYAKDLIYALAFGTMLHAGMAHAKPSTISRDITKPFIETSMSHDSILNLNADSLDLDTLKNHLLIEINKERAKLGLIPLVRNATLDSVSDADAKYMYDNQRYHHDDKKGNTPKRRAKDIYKYPRSFMGHIIHHGPRTIAIFYNDLYESAPHYNIACDNRGEEIGLSYYQGYRVIYVGGTRPVGL